MTEKELKRELQGLDALTLPDKSAVLENCAGREKSRRAPAYQRFFGAVFAAAMPVFSRAAAASRRTQNGEKTGRDETKKGNRDGN